jgi:rubrerythrin
MGKKFYRCTVCGDIHYGETSPEICPTCNEKDSYVEIPIGEAKKKMGF